MSKTAAVLAGLGALVVVGLIIVGGYLGGFWLSENSQRRSLNIQQHLQNKRTSILRQSYNFQSATNDRVENLISSINAIDVQLTYPGAPTAQLQAQRTGLVTQACQAADQLTGAFTTPDVLAFQRANCAH